MVSAHFNNSREPSLTWIAFSLSLLLPFPSFLSEKASQTGASGEVLHQSIGINTSLFVLRKVIKALAMQPTSHAHATDGGGRHVAPKSKTLAHIPYRDSTLTRLLKNSLGGNCLTLMVACIHPSDAYADENLSTLNYAALTKRIANVATRNEDPKSALIRKLRAEVKMLRGLLARARQNIVIGSGSGSGLGTGEDANGDMRMAIVGGGGVHSHSQQAWLAPRHDVSGGGGGGGSDASNDQLQLLQHTELAEKLIDSVNHMKVRR